MKRVVSLWLPDWPITVWRRQARPVKPAAPPESGWVEGAPFALVERGARGLSLAAVNAPARALGLHRGQPQADARAMVPHLASAPFEAAGVRVALRRLALWAERFSPSVAVDESPGQEGLALDMTGAAHLFGGEAALLAELRRRLGAAGVPARAAIADTLGCAWALARFCDSQEAIVAPGGAREALAGLPTHALRLDDEAARLLARFGLRRSGDLYPLPRAALARRFRGPGGAAAGLRLVQRLDQALGVAEEAVTPVRPAPAYRVWLNFAEPLTHVEGVAHRLPELAQRLAEQLARDGKGARRLSLTGFRVDGATTAIAAALSAPSAAPAHLMRLLRETGLERLDLGFGLDALMLCADTAEPVVERQGEMGEAAAEANASALAGLIDRLQARLGPGAVRRPQPRQSWIPERSEAWTPATPTAPEAPAQPMPPRPMLLFDPPEPVEALAELPDGAPARFTWRRVAHRVVKAEGPERLAAEWWRAAKTPARTRDYYRVEDEAGRRFWLFREGLYGREDADAPPSWRLHGVFA